MCKKNKKNSILSLHLVHLPNGEKRENITDKRRQFQMATRELDWRKVSTNKNLREKFGIYFVPEFR